MTGPAGSHPARPRPRDGKLADLTGPGITDRWGVTGTDLGASVTASDGSLVSVFGDTFSGPKVGHGDWRSPVVLIGTGDAAHPIRYRRAGGADPDYACQLWPYVHRHIERRGALDTALAVPRRAISTVIPSDLLLVGDTLYLHAIVNRGFSNVVWTEIWCSDDNGVSWQHLGDGAKFPGRWHRGYGQCWSWDFDPDDGWVYLAATGFQRDKGVILARVRPADIGDRRKYSVWGRARDRWVWGNTATPVTPAGETWGELSLRRLGHRSWVLGGFCSSRYALGYRVISHPTAALADAPLQLPVVGTSWDSEDHARGKVAQPYGGYVLPGSRLDVDGGVGLAVSQWNTAQGWPYRVMQCRVTLRDTTVQKYSG